MGYRTRGLHPRIDLDAATRLREERPMTYENLFCETENAYTAPAFHVCGAE